MITYQMNGLTFTVSSFRPIKFKISCLMNRTINIISRFYKGEVHLGSFSRGWVKREDREEKRKRGKREEKRRKGRKKKKETKKEGVGKTREMRSKKI